MIFVRDFINQKLDQYRASSGRKGLKDGLVMLCGDMNVNSNSENPIMDKLE